MIRKATAADLDGVADIYEAILRREGRTGHRYTNWQRGLYPTRATAEKALAAGTLYVDVRGGEVAAAANLNQVQPDEYAKIPWTIPAKPREVLVIHTLVVHPVIAGRGLGQTFAAFAEGLAVGKGCRTIRLDTYEGNLPAIAFYPRLGYRLAGSAGFHFEGVIDEVLVCFEKALSITGPCSSPPAGPGWG